MTRLNPQSARHVDLLAVILIPPRGVRPTSTEINQCVAWRGRRSTTLSSRRRVDGVEDDATIQHERAVF